jgi:ABC-type phosphate transport system substrate-binding protein
MRNRLFIAFVVAVSVLSIATAVYATDFAVVVNPSNPVKQMTLADLSKMFKAKTTSWPNGKGITIVLRDPSAPGTKFIIEKLFGGTFEDGKLALSDSGRKTTVPVVFAESDDEILKIVSGNAGAIGVIDVYNITGSVKVVKIDDKQPFDPGYALKGH